MLGLGTNLIILLSVVNGILKTLWNEIKWYNEAFFNESSLKDTFFRILGMKYILIKQMLYGFIKVHFSYHCSGLLYCSIWYRRCLSISLIFHNRALVSYFVLSIARVKSDYITNRIPILREVQRIKLGSSDLKNGAPVYILVLRIFKIVQFSAILCVFSFLGMAVK